MPEPPTSKPLDGDSRRRWRRFRWLLVVIGMAVGAPLVYISFYFSPVLAPLLLAIGALVAMVRLLRPRSDPTAGAAEAPQRAPGSPDQVAATPDHWRWMRWLLPLEGAFLALLLFFGPLHPDGDFWGRTAWLEYSLWALAAAGTCAAAAYWVLRLARMPVRRLLLRSSLAVASGAAVASMVAFMVFIVAVLSALNAPHVNVYVSNRTEIRQEGNVEIDFRTGTESLNQSCPIQLGVPGTHSSSSSCKVPDPPREGGMLVVTVQLADGRTAREEVQWPTGGRQLSLSTTIGPESVDFQWHGDHG